MARKTRPAVIATVLAVLAAGCSGGSPAGSSASTANAQSSKPSASTTTAPSLVAGARGWIAYQTTDQGFDRVHLVRADGTDDHAIGASLPGRTAHPDFSRDGRHLVIDQLTSENDQNDVDQLYVGDGDGEHLRLVARCRPPACLDHWEPAWSPDGRYLAISTGGGRLTDRGPTRFGLDVVDVRTQQVATVIDHPSSEGQDHFARWSPDGSQLVFWPSGRPRTARSKRRSTASTSPGNTCVNLPLAHVSR